MAPTPYIEASCHIIGNLDSRCETHWSTTEQPANTHEKEKPRPTSPTMRVTTPLASARIGDVEILGVQRVVELEALEVSPASHRVQHASDNMRPNTTQPVPPSAINAIQSRTAIVVPCKDEALDHIRGVWAAIPATSLIILVSGSEPQNYAIERDALTVFCNTTGRSGLAVHQRDPKVADALHAAGMKELLDDEGDGLVHKGKGEGLIIGIALAATARGPETATHATNERCGPSRVLANVQSHGSCTRLTSHGNTRSSCSNSTTNSGTLHGHDPRSRHQQHTNDGHADGESGYYKYIGFVDADNFVPGSVQEYCRAFSAGLHLAQADDAMVRINWSSKPKVDNGKLHFKPSGRSSEIVNRWLNRLLKNMDACIDTGDAAGDPDEVTSLICTGNAGEHAMTISLALKLRVASGYAIEPFHFLDIFERFTGGSRDNKPVEKLNVDVLPESSTMAIASIDDMPVSPVSMSPADSPFGTPLDGSPMLSACEESTQPTSPSIISTRLGKVPAVKQLPPSLNNLATYQDALAQVDAIADLTPPDSPTSQASPPKVQILQIRTINPHFHDNKGDDHVVRMWKQGLSAIYHSPMVSSLTQYREDLRTATFGDGDNEGQCLPTPPFSSSASVATSPSLSVDDSVSDSAVNVAADWQPAKCRIYPTTGSMDLDELRSRLEKGEGSFWWSGKEDHTCEEETAMGGDGALTPGLGFDHDAVLGLGPVSREKRPEGDVDGFKACVDEGR